MNERNEKNCCFAEALQQSEDGGKASLWASLPGIIQSFDPASITCTVSCSSKGQMSEEKNDSLSGSLPILPDVPVIFPHGGGFTLTYPIKAGDDCIVFFSTRCINMWWQNGEEGEIINSRMHNLSNSFALVGPFAQTARLSPAVHTQNVQLRSNDGEDFIEITPEHEILLKSEKSITLDAPEIIFKGNITNAGREGEPTTSFLHGTLHVTQKVHTQEDTTANGISLHNHDHERGPGRPV